MERAPSLFIGLEDDAEEDEVDEEEVACGPKDSVVCLPDDLGLLGLLVLLLTGEEGTDIPV